MKANASSLPVVQLECTHSVLHSTVVTAHCTIVRHTEYNRTGQCTLYNIEQIKDKIPCVL